MKPDKYLSEIKRAEDRVRQESLKNFREQFEMLKFQHYVFFDLNMNLPNYLKKSAGPPNRVLLILHFQVIDVLWSSLIIQDLTKRGYYNEALTLLRTTLETCELIQYIAENPGELDSIIKYQELWEKKIQNPEFKLSEEDKKEYGRLRSDYSAATIRTKVGRGAYMRLYSKLSKYTHTTFERGSRRVRYSENSIHFFPHFNSDTCELTCNVLFGVIHDSFKFFWRELDKELKTIPPNIEKYMKIEDGNKIPKIFNKYYSTAE